MEGREITSITQKKETAGTRVWDSQRGDYSGVQEEVAQTAELKTYRKTQESSYAQ
jgi:hypothetical protein